MFDEVLVRLRRVQTLNEQQFEEAGIAAQLVV
jgi:hypothetical protein